MIRWRRGEVRRMTVFAGLIAETPIEVDVVRLSMHVGETTCWECGGDGDWTKFMPEPEKLAEPLPCRPCKGTGKRLVSI